ncbi:MAG: hypothetical protein LBE62_07080 [Azonexus sp.]|nr:hypothetical protein [Azonexus sp.]
MGRVATYAAGTRIAFLLSGLWVTIAITGLQIIIWIFSPNALETWLENCEFGNKKKDWATKQQIEEFARGFEKVK